MRDFVAVTIMVPLLIGAVLVGRALTEESAEVPHREIRIHADGPIVTASEMLAEADLVIIATGLPGQREHWNSASNTEWEAPEDSGIIPLIVRDEGVRIVRTVKGQYASATITVRGIGGTAGGVTMVYPESIDLEDGQRYLLYLKHVRWPTQEGSDSVWAPLAAGQGVFWLEGAAGDLTVGGIYKNVAGLLIAEVESELIPVLPGQETLPVEPDT